MRHFFLKFAELVHIAFILIALLVAFPAIDAQAQPSQEVLFDQPGYSGLVTKNNFGVNWIRRFGSYDLTTGTNAVVPNDAGIVSVHAGTEGAGWARIFFGFDNNVNASGLFQPGTATIVPHRLADLEMFIASFHAIGIKLMITQRDAPLVINPGNMTLQSERLAVMLQALKGKIDAWGSANEPYERLFGEGRDFQGNATGGYRKIAELMRVTHAQFISWSPKTILVTPEWQGGETEAVEAMLGASAEGVTVLGSNGAGTRGEMFIDTAVSGKIGYHQYDYVTTLAQAAENYSYPRTENVLRVYSSFIRTAVANRRIAQDGGSSWWSGRPTPKTWCTENNISSQVSVRDNLAFRYQALTPAQKRRHLEALELGRFASDIEVEFQYAPDHNQNGGPWSVAGFAVGANGDLRITAGDSVPTFDGDVLTLQYGSLQTPITATVYNASVDGLSYDLLNVSPSTSPGQVAQRVRAVLGGWAGEYAAVMNRFIGQLQSGFVNSGNSTYPFKPVAIVNGGAPFSNTVLSAAP